MNLETTCAMSMLLVVLQSILLGLLLGSFLVLQTWPRFSLFLPLLTLILFCLCQGTGRRLGGLGSWSAGHQHAGQTTQVG